MLQRRKLQTLEDVETLHPMIHQIWTEVYTPIIGQEQVTYMLATYQGIDNIRREMAEGTKYYALFLEENLVGYTAYNIEPDAIYLSKLYIQKEYRGQGFMKEIFTWYDQLSRQLVLKQRLRVNQGNHQAIQVYKKRGFQFIQEDVIEIGEGFRMVDYLFEKNS